VAAKCGTPAVPKAIAYLRGLLLLAHPPALISTVPSIIGRDGFFRYDIIQRPRLTIDLKALALRAFLPSVGFVIADNLLGNRIKARTGVTVPVELLLRMAFDADYEAGAKDAPSGELLDEAQALQSAFYDLDGKTRRAIALDELEMAVSVEVLEHEEDCGCDLFWALSALGR
jgi:hypothetical protein